MAGPITELLKAAEELRKSKEILHRAEMEIARDLARMKEARAVRELQTARAELAEARRRAAEANEEIQRAIPTQEAFERESWQGATTLAIARRKHVRANVEKAVTIAREATLDIESAIEHVRAGAPELRIEPIEDLAREAQSRVDWAAMVSDSVVPQPHQFPRPGDTVYLVHSKLQLPYWREGEAFVGTREMVRVPRGAIASVEMSNPEVSEAIRIRLETPVPGTFAPGGRGTYIETIDLFPEEVTHTQLELPLERPTAPRPPAPVIAPAVEKPPVTPPAVEGGFAPGQVVEESMTGQLGFIEGPRKGSKEYWVNFQFPGGKVQRLNIEVERLRPVETPKPAMTPAPTPPVPAPVTEEVAVMAPARRPSAPRAPRRVAPQPSPIPTPTRLEPGMPTTAPTPRPKVGPPAPVKAPRTMGPIERTARQGGPTPQIPAGTMFTPEGKLLPAPAPTVAAPEASWPVGTVVTDPFGYPGVVAGPGAAGEVRVIWEGKGEPVAVKMSEIQRAEKVAPAVAPETVPKPQRSMGPIERMARQGGPSPQIPAGTMFTPEGKLLVPPAEVPGIAGNVTTATGADVAKEYEFRYRVVELDDVVASHTVPSATAPPIPDPRYPAEIQPRERERMASGLQVERIARELAPDELLRDRGTLDRGPSIVGPDSIVESGNGRMMALNIARDRYPERWAAYQARLRELAPQYGIPAESIQGMRAPVLVRERITPVADRADFARLANESPVLQSAPYESAVSDASRITDEAIGGLIVSESATLDQALAQVQNREFVRGILEGVPANERAALMDPSGDLNTLGLARVRAALFAKVYHGDAGTRLGRSFFESLDPDLKNIERAILDSLPAMARAESLIRAGARAPELSLTEDLSRAVDVLTRLSQQGVKLAEYLGQVQLFGRELTPVQEAILARLDSMKRSSKQIRAWLEGYADAIMRADNPAQSMMFGAKGTTKEAALEHAATIARGEQPGQGSLFGPASGSSGPPAPSLAPGYGRQPAGRAPQAPRGVSLAGPGTGMR